MGADGAAGFIPGLGEAPDDDVAMDANRVDDLGAARAYAPDDSAGVRVDRVGYCSGSLPQTIRRRVAVIVDGFRRLSAALIDAAYDAVRMAADRVDDRGLQTR